MKIVKIDHSFCGGIRDYTFFVAPDETTQEKLNNDVRTATENYWAAYNETIKPIRPSKDYFNHYGRKILEEFPENTTIKEAIMILEENEKEWERYTLQRRNIEDLYFDRFFEELGYKQLKDCEYLYSVAIWGHQHGHFVKISKYDVPLKNISFEDLYVKT